MKNITERLINSMAEDELWSVTQHHNGEPVAVFMAVKSQGTPYVTGQVVQKGDAAGATSRVKDHLRYLLTRDVIPYEWPDANAPVKSESTVK